MAVDGFFRAPVRRDDRFEALFCGAVPAHALGGDRGGVGAEVGWQTLATNRLRGEDLLSSYDFECWVRPGSELRAGRILGQVWKPT